MKFRRKLCYNIFIKTKYTVKIEYTSQEFDKFVEDLKKEIYEGSIGIERKEELAQNSYFSQALEQISREGGVSCFQRNISCFC